MMQSIVELHVMLMIVICICSQSERVRLYRPIDHRLSKKSKVVTVWYSTKCGAQQWGRNSKLAYIDIPASLLFSSIPTGSDEYGRYYMLAGAARRFARKSWKTISVQKGAA